MTDLGDTTTVTWDDALGAIERCYELGWTDGLPVVPPTSYRVAVFLDYAGRPASEVVGEIPERRRQITAGKVAANAVMDIGLVRPGGEWIIYGSGTPQFSLPFFALAARNITLRVILVYTLDEAERRAVIDTLTRLLATGRVRHHIAERMPLAQIADAHTRIEQGQVVGNIVLALD